jgi:hypothetical protein
VRPVPGEGRASPRRLGSLGAVITRSSRRALSIAATAVVLAVTATVTAGSAAAIDETDSTVGTQQPSGLSLAETLLLFVGVPALIFAVSAALVYATAGKNEPRLREGQGWWAEPEYFSVTGPADAAELPAGQAPGALTAGDDEGGGSSARW